MGDVGVMTGVPGEVPFEERLLAELPRVRAYLARVVPGGDVEDLAQEVATRALRYRRSYDGERELSAWLRGVALRVAIDHAARGRTRPSPLDGDEPAAERGAAACETREDLARALARLSSVEREVLVRFHAREESLAEIARALNLPLGTVKSHLHRARASVAGRGGS